MPLMSQALERLSVSDDDLNAARPLQPSRRASSISLLCAHVTSYTIVCFQYCCISLKTNRTLFIIYCTVLYNTVCWSLYPNLKDISSIKPDIKFCVYLIKMFCQERIKKIKCHLMPSLKNTASRVM